MIGIQEVTMAHDEINHGIFTSVWISRISSEDIKYFTSIVITSRHLAVGIIICFSPRICQTLYLVSLRRMHQSEIRICISARCIKVDLEHAEPVSKPILKVEFFILSVCSPDEDSIPNSAVTGNKYVNHAQA